jgi:hypothetical protein
MQVLQHINAYLTSLPQPKQNEMRSLHELVMQVAPHAQLWFLDGKNEAQQTVTNPNIGYGLHTLHYANGSQKAFYKVGIAATQKGISVYVMGTPNKTYLADTYKAHMGRASFTGYCISFKQLSDIHLNTLMQLFTTELLTPIS